MPVRVEFRISQFGGDSFLEPFGNEVLKPLSFIVNFLKRIIENLIEKGFDQTMMSQDFKRAAPSCRGQSDSAMFFVLDIWFCSRSELLQHVCDGSWRDLQPLGEGSTRDITLFRAAKAKNRLQVIINGFGVGVHLTIGRHGFFHLTLGSF